MGRFCTCPQGSAWRPASGCPSPWSRSQTPLLSSWTSRHRVRYIRFLVSAEPHEGPASCFNVLFCEWITAQSFTVLMPPSCLLQGWMPAPPSCECAAELLPFIHLCRGSGQFWNCLLITVPTLILFASLSLPRHLSCSVMHAVRNIANSGRTILVTIHQPSTGESRARGCSLLATTHCTRSMGCKKCLCRLLLAIHAEIFEAFDAMVLLQAGGRVRDFRKQ